MPQLPQCLCTSASELANEFASPKKRGHLLLWAAPGVRSDGSACRWRLRLAAITFTVLLRTRHDTVCARQSGRITGISPWKKCFAPTCKQGDRNAWVISTKSSAQTLVFHFLYILTIWAPISNIAKFGIFLRIQFFVHWRLWRVHFSVQIRILF